MKRISFLTIALALALAGVASAGPITAPYSFKQTTSPCSTSGVAGNSCAEPTVTLPTAFSTAGTYSIVCTCVGTPTGVPVVGFVTQAAASPKIQVNVTALTAATASCVEVDCTASALNAAAQ